VVVPGEPEIATEAQRELSGIPISEETWRQFKEAARSVGVEIDGDEGETGQGRWVD
jgi:LDH2 family malate/lactate/ureidoglycolate dehydrogenase